MNQPRRVVLCVAVGAVLIVVASAMNGLLASPSAGGWFMYSADADPIFSTSSSDSGVLRAGGVWLVAIGLWLGFSWWLFRDRRR